MRLRFEGLGVNSLTLEWINDWAAGHHIGVTLDRLLSLVYQDPRSVRRITVLTDSERTPTDLVLLANRLVWVESEDGVNLLSDQDRQYFFWVRESGIWDETNEALASEAFGAILRADGHPPDTRGLLVPEGESRSAVLLVLNALLFGWDAYLAPLSARFLCHISHDGYIDLRTPDETLLHTLLKRVEAWGAEERPI